MKTIPLLNNDLASAIRGTAKLQIVLPPKDMKFDVALQVDDALYEKIKNDSYIADKIFAEGRRPSPFAGVPTLLDAQHRPVDPESPDLAGLQVALMGARAAAAMVSAFRLPDDRSCSPNCRAKESDKNSSMLLRSQLSRSSTASAVSLAAYTCAMTLRTSRSRVRMAPGSAPQRCLMRPMIAPTVRACSSAAAAEASSSMGCTRHTHNQPANRRAGGC